jgi:hypothetical protein
MSAPVFGSAGVPSNGPSQKPCERSATQRAGSVTQCRHLARSYIRLNAIRSLLLGIPRATLCQQFCRTDRMVRLWIELFNRGGIDALITKPRSGRRRKVKLERVRDLLVPVLENPAQAGQVQDREGS